MTSSILLDIRRGDSDFIAQVNELIAIHYTATVLILCCDKARSAIRRIRIWYYRMRLSQPY